MGIYRDVSNRSEPSISVPNQWVRDFRNFKRKTSWRIVGSGLVFKLSVSLQQGLESVGSDLAREFVFFKKYYFFVFFSTERSGN